MLDVSFLDEAKRRERKETPVQVCRGQFELSNLTWPSQCFPWNKLYFANSFTTNLAKMKVWIACLLLALLFPNQTSGEDTGERKWCSSISSQHVFFSKELKRNKRRKFVISLRKSLLKSKWVLLSASLAIWDPRHALKCLVSPHRPRYLECQCIDCCVLRLPSGTRHRRPSTGAFSGAADASRVWGPSAHSVSPWGEHLPARREALTRK